MENAIYEPIQQNSLSNDVASVMIRIRFYCSSSEISSHRLLDRGNSAFNSHPMEFK